MTTATTSDARETRFCLLIACAMGAVLVSGFSLQLMMGRSNFTAPLTVHVHAVLFMGWLGLFLFQNIAIANGAAALHRRIGWVATVWLAAMVPAGIAATVNAAQAGRVPFFFLPQHFLFADIAVLLCFAALTTAAIALRHRTDWHRRLHLCAFAALMGPGFGRLLPMPFMGRYAYGIAAMVGLIFPLIVMIREVRAGALHPAWAWGVPAIPLTLLAAFALAHSAIGAAAYTSMVAGSPGEAISGLEYGPPPPGM